MEQHRKGGLNHFSVPYTREVAATQMMHSEKIELILIR